MINAINSGGRPVLAIDIPSGLSSDSTAGKDQCVRAELTVMLAVAKAGPMQSRMSGRLLLADIGMPDELLGDERDRMQTVYSDGPIVEII